MQFKTWHCNKTVISEHSINFWSNSCRNPPFVAEGLLMKIDRLNLNCIIRWQYCSLAKHIDFQPIYFNSLLCFYRQLKYLSIYIYIGFIHPKVCVVYTGLQYFWWVVVCILCFRIRFPFISHRKQSSIFQLYDMHD